MLAQQILNHGEEFSDFLKNPLHLLLVDALERLSETLTRFEIPHRTFSTKSVLHLMELPTEKKTAILQNLIDWNTFISGPTRPSEMELLQKTLKSVRLEIDENFLDVIDEECIVEVYTSDMIQIYRSLKMLSITSYSILDLSVFEWFVLWRRPQKVVNHINTEVSEILRSEETLRRLNIPKHLLSETFDTGMTQPFIPRAVLVDFQHIGFLKKPSEMTSRAFICTCKAQIIAEGEDVSKFEYV
jgi:hypothetical protein